MRLTLFSAFALVLIAGCSKSPEKQSAKANQSPSPSIEKPAVESPPPKATDSARATKDQAPAGGETWDLHLNLKKGYRSTYSVSTSTDVGFGGAPNISNSSFSVDVQEVKGGNSTLKYTFQPMAGKPMPGMPPPPTEPQVKTISVDAHGKMVGDQGVGENLGRAPLATINLPDKPVHVGDSWEDRIPAKELGGMAGAPGMPKELVRNFKLLSVGKFAGKKALKVQSSMKFATNTPNDSKSVLAGAKTNAQFDGIHWIDPDTGLVLDSQLTMNVDLALPGGGDQDSPGKHQHLLIKYHTKRVK